MPVRFLALAIAAATVCSAQMDLDLVVDTGVPLRVRLEDKTPILEGQPIRGVLTHPLYVFDREAAPAGSIVLGSVVKVERSSGGERARVYLRGQLRTKREARVAFDTLVLEDGTRVAISTSIAAGAPAVVRLSAGGGSGAQAKKKGAVGKAASQAKQAVKSNPLVNALRSEGGANAEVRKAAGGKWRGVRNSFLAYWPFGERNLRAGTGFTAVLEEPLRFGTAVIEMEQLERLGSPPEADSLLQARLIETVSSESAEVGSAVRAVVSRPLFSADGDLIVPEGSLLLGEVTQVQSARRFGRNGKLRFRFTKIEMPSGLTQLVSGSLDAAEVDASRNMEIDAEGGAAVKTSKKRFIMPAMSVAVAMAGPPGDEDGVPTGSTAQGAVPGFSGLGVLGSIIALSARSASGPIGVWGAANSIYFNLVRKADELEFPKHTLLEIRLGRSQEDAILEGRPEADEQPREGLIAR